MIPTTDGLIFMSCLVVALAAGGLLYEAWLHWNGRRCEGGGPCSTCDYLDEQAARPVQQQQKYPRRTRGAPGGRSRGA